MKKSLKLIIIFSVLFLCVGCMNMNVKMNINKDKSLDLDIGMTIDMYKMYKNMIDMGMMNSDLCEAVCAEHEQGSDEAVECINNCFDEHNISDEELKKVLAENMKAEDFSIEEVISKEEQEELKKQGYTIDVKYDKKNFIYELDVKKHINNIDEVTSNDNDSVNFSDFVSGEANYLFTKDNDNYKANFKLEMDNQDEDQVINMDEFKEYITYNFEVNLPNKAINSNATNKSKNGKTLNWDLMNTSNINYEFNISNNKLNIEDNYLKYIGMGLIGLGIISLVITTVIFVNKNNKNKNS